MKNGGINRPVSVLEIGDPVYLMNIYGDILDKGNVEGEVNNYVLFKNKKYWKRASDGKHRRRNSYSFFLMSPEEGERYSNPNTNSKSVW